MSRLATLSLAVVTLAAAGCYRPGQPLVNTEPGKNLTPGTIAGNLHTTANAPLAGRTVQAVHTETGEKYTTVSGVTGGFSIKVPPGKYRLVVELEAGETVVREPGVIDINMSDLDTDLDVVVR
jgi:hypothetical protein